MNTQHHPSRGRPAAVKNRVMSFMIHIPTYSCWGLTRLASDAGISKSTLSQLLHGVGEPEYSVIFKVTEALGRAMGATLDLREVAVPIGQDYKTACPCVLFNGCRCLPPWAYRANGELKRNWAKVQPGFWTVEGPYAHIER